MLKTNYKQQTRFFTRLVFIDVDLVSKYFRICFEEVMIILGLFTGYDPQNNQNKLRYREGMEELERGIRVSMMVGIDFCWQ